MLPNLSRLCKEIRTPMVWGVLLQLKELGLSDRYTLAVSLGMNPMDKTLDRTNLSNWLKRLVAAGLVIEHQGKWKHQYEVNTETVRELIGELEGLL